MAFIVRSGERHFRIDPRLVEQGESEDRYVVLVDDEERSMGIARLTPSHMSVLAGGRSYNVEVERRGEEYLVTTRGETFSFRVQDEYRAASEEASGGGAAVICAPMPGLVARVMVEEGQDVEAGQGLLVLEAMKMQNEIPAPGPGTVVKVGVEQGSTVMTGDTLVVIE